MADDNGVEWAHAPITLEFFESGWRQLEAPTLTVWETGDPFFEKAWAHWQEDTIPGARPVIEMPGAKLFFPDEHATEFAAETRKHSATT